MDSVQPNLSTSTKPNHQKDSQSPNEAVSSGPSHQETTSFSIELMLSEQSIFNASAPLNQSPLLQLAANYDFNHLLCYNGLFLNDSGYLQVNAVFRILLGFSKRLKSGEKPIESSLEELSAFCAKMNNAQMGGLAPFESKETVLFVATVLLLGTFLKENWVGPSFIFKNAEKKYKDATIKTDKEYIEAHQQKHSSDHLAKIFSEEYSEHADSAKESMKNFRQEEFLKNSKDSHILEFLSIEGESICKETKLLHVLIVCQKVFAHFSTLADPQKAAVGALWLARVYLMRSRHLSSLTGILAKEIQSLFSAFLAFSRKIRLPRKARTSFHLENSVALLHFSKFLKCKKEILRAQSFCGFELAFTGKLGVRTKYQTFKTAQLVLQVSSSENKSGKPAEAPLTQEEAKEIEELILEEEALEGKEEQPMNFENIEELTIKDKPETEEADKESGPKIVRLDDVEDNILHEIPLLDEVASASKELNDYDTCVLLGLITQLIRSSPIDDILREQVSAFLSRVLDKPRNWLVTCHALFIRSQMEFPKIKYRERALLQLEGLDQQFNLPEPSLGSRLAFVFPLGFNSFIESQKVLGDTYIKLGMVMSGCTVFEKLDLKEDCIECLIAAGHVEAAKELCEKVLQESSTPRALCSYGDITKDIKYYREAWMMSKKKSSRAARSLAAHYFYVKQDYNKAIKHYERALAINSYTPSASFTLGAAYMRVGKFKESAKAFGNVVAIDETQGDAWGNIAVCLLQMNKKVEAFAVLEQAVKHSERSWKMWQNYLIVALETKKFYAFFRAIEKLIELNRKSIIGADILSKLGNITKHQNMLFAKEIESKGESSSSENQSNLNKNKGSDYHYSKMLYVRIERMFDFIESRMAECDYVFEVHCAVLYNGLELHKLALMSGEIDSEGYKETRNKLLVQIYENRVKQNHALLQVGWESDTKTLMKLYEVGKLLIQEVRILNSEEEKVKMRIHLKSIGAQLEKGIPTIFNPKEFILE